MAEQDAGGPEATLYVPSDSVIASSNRFNDLHPYIDYLFQTDSHKWGGMMPQKFPATGGKEPKEQREQEETFLRTCFTEKDIRMQGFRFLKQVWWCVAIYNFEVRIPATVKWWVQENPDLLKDPAMRGHMFAPEAKSTTFFDQRTFDNFGEKFLEMATVAIQWTLHHPKRDYPSTGDAGPASAISAKTEPQNATYDSQVSVTEFAKNHAGPKSAPLPPKPAAPVFDAHSTATWPDMRSADSKDQIRSFSGDPAPAPVPEPRQPRHQKRGSNNKRGSAQDRSGHRPSHEYRGPSHGASLPDYGPQAQGLAPGTTPILSSQVRGPSFNAMPNVHDFMPIGTPGQQMPAAYPPGAFDPSMVPYGMQLPQQEQMMIPSPTGYTGFPNGGLLPPHRQAQPFGERSNGQISSYSNFDGQKARRESVTSRGGKRPGYAPNGGRGNRGSRGRNSFGHGDARLSLRNSSNDFNAPVEGSQPKHRRYSITNRDKYRQDSWRNVKQDENFLPPSGRRSDTGRQMPPALGNVTPTVVKDEAWLEHNCDKSYIGDRCKYVNKLIAFQIPRETPEALLVSFFANFGPIYNVSRQKTAPNSYQTAEPLVYVNFGQNDDSNGARACLRYRGGAPWGTFKVEVPREYWDMTHERFVQRDSAGQAMFQPPNGFMPAIPRQPQPVARPFANEAQPSMQATEKSQASLSRSDSVSEDATPIVSGAATPSRKKAKGKKNKNKRGGLYEESLNQAFEANALKAASVSNPVPEDTVLESNKATDKITTEEFSDTPLQPSPAQVQSPVSQAMMPEPSPSLDVGGAGITSLPIGPMAEASNKTVAAVPPVPLLETTVPESRSGLEFQDPASTPDAKGEEEQIEDSFHTASGAPDEGKEDPAETVFPTEIPETSLGVQVSTAEAPLLPKADDAAPNVFSTVSSSTSQKEARKVPVAQLLPLKKPEVTQSCQDTTENTVTRRESGGSDDEADPTEPIPIPGLPDFSSSVLDSTAAPESSQTKKPVKQKGAAQTESFSVFGKKPKPKKSKKGKEPKGTRQAKDTEFGVQPEDGEYDAPTPQSDAQVNNDKPRNNSVEPTTGSMSCDLQEAPSTVSIHKDDTPAAKGLLNRVADFLYAPSQSSSSAQSTSKQDYPQASQDFMSAQQNDSEDFHTPIEQDGAGFDPTTIGYPQAKDDSLVSTVPIFQDELAAPATLTTEEGMKEAELKKPGKSKSKKRAKKNKSAANAGEAGLTAPVRATYGNAVKEPAQGEVVEMSYPAPCNETKNPILSFRGSTATADGHPQVLAQVLDHSSPSPMRSPGNNFGGADGSRLGNRQNRHLHSGKNSDATNSGDEKSLSTLMGNSTDLNKNRDNVQQELGARYPSRQEADGLGLAASTPRQLAPTSKQEMPWKPETEPEGDKFSEGVLNSIASMQQLAEQEKKVKESKKK